MTQPSWSRIRQWMTFRKAITGKRAGSTRRTRPRVAACSELLEARALLAADFGFALALGGVDSDEGHAVASDAAGNVYVAGSFEGTADFDPSSNVSNLISAGEEDAFIAKYSPNGNLLFARRMGGTLRDIASAIALDASGNIYVAGDFRGTADFDPGGGVQNRTSAGLSDAFVLQLNSLGNFVWASVLGGIENDLARGIAANASGVFITGNFAGTADFDPAPGVNVVNLTSAGSDDVFISKLTTGGLFSFARQVGGTSSDIGFSAAVDSVGNVLIGGEFSGTADFDPSILGVVNRTSAGAQDLFVLKLNASGLFVWARTTGSAGATDRTTGVATGPANSVYATGLFSSTIDFDPGAAVSNLTSNGSWDAFIWKLDSSGNFVWARNIGGDDIEFGLAIAVDAVGAAYTTGRFEETADFDPGAGVSNLTSAGSIDVFISKLSSAGDFVSAQALGGISTDIGNGIAISSLGHVYTTGSFSGTADFDPGPGVQNRTSAGDGDIFVAQLTQRLGDRVWHDQDRDGVQDPGEPGLPGVRVELFNSVDGIAGNGNDVSLGKQTTDANGLYHFPAIDTSLSYYLVFERPIDFQFTSANVGSDDLLDSDAEAGTGRTTVFMIPAGQTDLSRDAGLFPAPVYAGVSGLGSPLAANATTAADQQAPSVTSDAAGNFIVVWESFGQDQAATWGIYGQRYDAQGQLLGREFRVNTTTAGDQRRPVVALADNGKFVVAWESPDANATGIYARHYHANGQPLGSEFLVNTTTMGEQRRPTAAIDADGDFLIAWDGNGTGDPQGIFGRRYNSIGQSQGAEFRVNVNTTNPQQNPAAAMDADGDFVVVFEDFGSALNDVYARRFNAAGVGQGNEFIVTNTTSDQQIQPAVAMNAAGGFVVTWANFDLTDFPDRLYDIMARRFSPAGIALGNEFLVTRTILNDQNDPAIAIDDAGRFTIAWQDLLGGTVMARAFDANGQAFPDEFQVGGPSSQNGAVAMDGDGDFVVAWDAPDATGLGVFAQRYSVHTPAAGGQLPVNSETDDTQRFPTVASDADGDFVVTWSSENQDGEMSGIFAQRYNAAGQRQGNEFQVNTEFAKNQIRSSVAMDPDGDFVIVWESFAQDGDGYGIYGKRFNAAGQPQGSEFLISETTDMNQERPIVAMDAAGNFVIVWEDDGDLDGDGEGVFARRFNAAGMPLSGEFQVNTFTDGNQMEPDIAMDPLGNFMVTWQSQDQDGSGFGIYAQRFNAAGNRVGTEFRVNSFTDDDQTNAKTAMDAAGNFLIGWFSNSAGHNGGFAQRFNAAGVPQQSEFSLPAINIDMAANGAFVATFGALDGDGFGVYAQRYNADGTLRGESLRINTIIAGNQPQFFSDVAVTPVGDFVIAWDGRGQGDNAGIFAQRFDVPLPPRIVIGPDAGNEGRVRVLDAQTGIEQFNFLPFGGFTGGVRVAMGDVNGDGTPDIITAAGPGGGPHVRVFDGQTGNQLSGAIGNFFAYGTFTGGVLVASGDVNADGFDDVITGADAGGGPHVRVFSGATGGEILQFFAYRANFTGGVRVAAGDVNGDGRADIIAGPGAGGGPHVRVFSGAGSGELFGLFAYSANFSSGVYVAAGDVNGDGRADVITGAGPGGGPHVRVFSGPSGQQLPGAIGSFFAFAPDFTRGVRVASLDANGDGKSDILVATGPGGPFEVRLFDALAGQSSFSATGIPTGGAFVAGASQDLPASTPPAGSALLAPTAPPGSRLAAPHDLAEILDTNDFEEDLTSSVSRAQLDTVFAELGTLL